MEIKEHKQSDLLNIVDLKNLFSNAKDYFLEPGADYPDFVYEIREESNLIGLFFLHTDDRIGKNKVCLSGASAVRNPAQYIRAAYKYAAVVTGKNIYSFTRFWWVAQSLQSAGLKLINKTPDGWILKFSKKLNQKGGEYGK